MDTREKLFSKSFSQKQKQGAFFKKAPHKT